MCLGMIVEKEERVCRGKENKRNDGKKAIFSVLSPSTSIPNKFHIQNFSLFLHSALLPLSFPLSFPLSLPLSLPLFFLHSDLALFVESHFLPLFHLELSLFLFSWYHPHFQLSFSFPLPSQKLKGKEKKGV